MTQLPRPLKVSANVIYADFNAQYDCVVVASILKGFHLLKLILPRYRFEGDSEPADEAIVHGIESRHGKKVCL